MDLVVYAQYYRCKTADRQREIDECLRRNLNHPGIRKLVLFKESDAPPLPEATVELEVVESNTRITYAEWLRWVQRQGSGIALLLNADIYLDEGLEHLRATFDTPEAFLALTRYNPGHAGFHLNDFPHWTQDVWGVRADAELPESLLYASSFPLGFPGCDNRIAYVMWSHGFRVRNPCYHVRSVHLQASTARAYDKTSDRLYGGVSYVHPSLAPEEDAELEFTLWTRSQQRPAGVLVNQQAIEQGVHQLRHGEADVAQRFLDQQQFTGLSWLHEAVGSAHLEGDLHPFASEDTVFLPMPALLGVGVSLQLRQPARLEGLSLRLPRRAPAGYQLELQAEGEGESQLVIEGDAAMTLKPGGERRFWQPAELKAHSWSRLRLKLVGGAVEPAWQAEEGAELVLFGEEGSLSQAKSLNVIAEDTPPSLEPPAQLESNPASPAEPQPGQTPYSWRRRSECTALLEQGEELHRYGSRFRILRCGEELVFDDRFWPSVGVSPLAELPCELSDGRELFLWGFGQPTLELRPGFIANTKRFSADVNFWQYPCRTEGDAFAVHQTLVGPQVRDGVLQLYLGLPWATWIDRQSWPTSTLKATADRLRKLRQELGVLDLELKVHSVCQHILWRENLHLIKASGVQCLWLSHKPHAEDQLEGVELRAWHLYPVNAREDGRRDTLVIKPIARRPWLATFIGAHMKHYISDVRPRLQELKDAHRFYIQIKDEWHFYSVVYGHQEGQPVGTSNKSNEDQKEAIQRYNTFLSDSQFSLCPAGAGPNSLRIWESLCLGTVPVVLSDHIALPDINQLSNGRWSHWDEIVIFHSEEAITSLPARLEAISLEEREERSASCIALMEHVNYYTCLGTMAKRAVEPIERQNEVDTLKPLITIPTYGPTDEYYWRQKKHGFYNLVIEWYLRGKIRIDFGEKGYFWWGKAGDVLLMERDLVADMIDKKVDPPRWSGYVDYKYALFYNQPHIENSRNRIATYFTYSPVDLENARSCIGRVARDKREYKTIFAGSIENETQEYFRSKFSHWEPYIEVFSCADRLNKNEPHKYTQDEYLRLISRSAFGVCFRGNGPKCFREIEYLALGTPLIITEGVCTMYPDPLIEGVHFFYARRAEDIPAIVDSISRDHWEEMSRECWDWYSRNASIESSFEHHLSTITSLDLSARRHSVLRVLADYQTAVASLAVKSLEIFDPTASWISEDNPSHCNLVATPNDLIVNELPFFGREHEYTWRIPSKDAKSYLQDIYTSELEEHKSLLISLGLKSESAKFSLNSSNDITALTSKITGDRTITLTADDILEITPDYNWKRLLSSKYQSYSRSIQGPSTFRFPSLKALLSYEKHGTIHEADLTEHFSEYYSVHQQIIPENKVFRLCKLWEFKDCSLHSIACYLDGKCTATYKYPHYLD